MLSMTATTTSTWRSADYYASIEPANLLLGTNQVLLLLLSRLLTTAHWHLVPVYELQSWEFYLGFAVLVALLFLYGKGTFQPLPCRFGFCFSLRRFCC